MHEADPTRRFSDRAADYVRARPAYPDALVDVVQARTDLGPGSLLADLGSGTGLSAEPFLRRGYRVVGVEPNPAMRAAAEAHLAAFPGFRSVGGTAEATGLEEGSADGALIAQAFHWLDGARTRDELLRVLRPPTWAVVAWNTRRTGDTPFLRGYEALLRRFGTDYEQVRARTERVASAGALGAFLRGGYHRDVLENVQELDRAGLESRVRSASYVPAPGTPGHAPLMAALGELFERDAVGGRVRLVYDLEVYTGRLD
ncbi:MAG TPA: class I SAM-dependent methyltransferase [Longimicrobiales bacterium]|nr:class I SAM-dependent methyltransferase [Longimicrobiales bacterium]